MKSKKQSWIGLLLTAAACTFSIAFTSCNKEPQQNVWVDQGEAGVYYFDAQDDERYSLSISEGEFTLIYANNAIEGSYTYDGTDMTLKSAAADEETEEKIATATLQNGTLTVVYDGNSYRFLQNVKYQVTYEVNGGSSVEAVKVLNGKTVAKPIADPTKAGYNFIGWYADAAFTTPFAFDSTVISADTTVYARFEAAKVGQLNYEATLMVDGEVYGKQNTIGGVLYDLPTPEKEGKTFAGWWVSDSASADKLTYKYVGQALAENTTLYAVWQSKAPLISVTENGFTWTASGVNNSYNVTVVAPVEADNVKITQTEADYAYDFASKPEGEYAITVTVNGESTTVYYNNKTLAKVSEFVVVDSQLIFEPVENAERYTITVSCGNASHQHTAINLNSSTTFNFAACEMQKGGILFTVTAEANGYVSSTSETYVFTRDLEAVTGLTFDAKNDEIVWDRVNQATSYKVEIKVGENTYTENVGSEARLSLKAYTGDLTVSVTPVTKGYNSPDATQATFVKTALVAPTDIRIQDGKLCWTAVEGAKSYTVKIGEKIYTAEENTLEIPVDAYVEGQSEYTVSVQAVAETAENDSSYSDLIKVSFGAMSASITYKAGYVYWQPVVNATSYAVKVNDGDEVTVSANANSYPVTFERAGENTISVCYYEGEKASDWVEITVSAYEVEFDVRGGVAIPSQYLAVGDKIDFAATTYNGYVFSGWYNAPGGVTNNGIEYKKDDVFNGTGHIVVYAYWTPQSYEVTLVTEKYGAMETETYTVYYKQPFTLPLPVYAEDSGIYFNGWFESANGEDKQYANAEGKGLFVWNHTNGMTLYADWVELLNYTELNDGTYSVSQGVDIGSVTEVTIPAYYNGKIVSEITTNAFKSCSNLIEINIPNTVTNIVIGDDGSNGQSSAFYSCSKLQNVNVYEVEGAIDPRYSSVNGVVLFNNEFTGLEIKYIPYNTREGEFTIPEGVEIIPIRAFKSASKLTAVNIPWTVREIHSEAFTGRTKLERINFLPAPEGETDLPLTIKDNAFKGCTGFTSFTLPTRLNNFDITTFDSCTNLLELNVEGQGTYQSIDGVLYSNGGTKIEYVPRGYLGPKGDGVFEIPSNVLTIGDNAFNSCKKLTKVVIPRRTTTIGENAFKSCTGLVTLTFLGETRDASINVATSAFYSCTGLTELTLPANLGSVAEYAFGGTSKLKTVTINSDGRKDFDLKAKAFGTTATVTVYYVSALHLGANVPYFSVTEVFGAASLATLTKDEANNNFVLTDGVLFNVEETEILYFPLAKGGAYKIPEKVTSIGEGVFRARKYLRSIEIPATVTSIGAYAFRDCEALETVTFLPTATGATEVKLTIGDQAFYNVDQVKNFDLPTRTESIGKQAFAYSIGFTSFKIPEGVKTVGIELFSNCTQLRKVEIPSTLTTLGADDNMNMFLNCNVLEEIVVAEDSQYFKTVDNVLYGMKMVGEGDNKVLTVTDLYFSPTENEGQNGVVTIPGSVSKIWKYAFKNNAKITSIVFDGEANELVIGDYAFYYCSGLKALNLPEGTKSIDKYAFYYCKGLKEVYLPSTIEFMSKYSFYGSTNIEKVEFADYVSKNGELGKELVMEDGSYSVSSYGDVSATGVFANQASLVSLKLPKNRPLIIGYSAFCGAENLTSVTIPSTTKSINNRAFSNTTALKELVFETRMVEGEPVSDLEAMKDYAFAYAGIEELVIPEGMKAIGGESLNSSNKLTEWGYTFYYCEQLKTVSVASTVEKITKNAFYYCTALETLTIVDTEEKPSQLKYFGDYAFYHCEMLKSVEIPASIEHVGKYAFEYAYNLTSAVFKEKEQTKDGVTKTVSNLDYFGSDAFYQTGLTSFRFPETWDNLHIGTVKHGTATLDGQFDRCEDLQSVHLSSTVTNIDNLFVGCSSLKSVTIAEGNKNFKLHEEYPLLMNATGTNVILALGSMPEGVALPTNLTTISARAFANRVDIEKIIIPATVESIESYAFMGCTNLKEVVFLADSTVTTKIKFGNYVFQNCISLEKFTFPVNYGTLGTYMFDTCTSLKSVTLPDNLKTLPNYMFDTCTALETIELPESLTSLGQYAFQYSGLKSITIPSKVTKIDKYTFRGCESLAEVVMHNKITSLEDYAFNTCNALTEIELPDSITKIGKYCFQKSVALEKIELSSKLKTIDNYAFNGCTALAKIVIPDTVTTIGTYCFKDCTALEKVTLPDGLKTLSNYMFQNCTALEKIDLPASLTYLGTYTFKGSGLEEIEIPKGVKHFGKTATAYAFGDSSYVFQDCLNLEKVTLHEDFISIGGYAFDGCANLTEVLNMQNVETIGNYAFCDCLLITKLDLANVVTIGGSAFKGSGLTEAILPSLQEIKGNAFQNCYSLTNVVLGDDTTTLAGSTFRDCTALTSIKLPANLTKIGTYELTNTAITSLEVPVGLTVIGPNTSGFSRFCEGCTSLETVNFLGDVTYIGDYTFYNCSSLKTVNIPFTVETIGSYAFTGTAIETVVIPDKTTKIEGGAFAGCTSLVSFDVGGNNPEYKSELGALYTKENELLCYPAGLSGTATFIDEATFGDKAFEGCDKITKIELPLGITEITDYAFYGWTGLKEIVIPDGVTAIGKYAFRQCANLERITLPNTLLSINQYAFADCVALKSIEIPESVTELGTYVFSGSGLEEIVIPETIENFGMGLTTVSESSYTYTFQNCENLKKVTLPSTLSVIYGYMFKGCSALEEVIIPEGVTYIGYYAFSGTQALKEIEIPKNVTYINSYAFAETGVKEVVIPATVKEVGTYLFSKALTEKVTILNPKMEIGQYMFNQSAIKEAIFPEGMTEIPYYTFNGALELKSFEIPASVKTIGNYAFSGSGLETITIPATVTKLGYYAFKGCESLKSAVVYIKTIPMSTFQDCTALETLTLKEGVMTTQSSAFNGCTALTTVSLPSTLKEIQASGFASCTALKKLVIPAGVKVGNLTFKNWTDEQYVYFCDTEDASASFGTTWRDQTEANFVWGYTPET